MPFDGFAVESISAIEQQMRDNIIINADSYKYSHHKQYPPGTKYVYSYIESRGGAYDSTLFFGLQFLLKKWAGVQVTTEKIDFAEKLITAHGYEFNRAGWEYIRDVHKGVLPVCIKAVPEGTLVPVGNVLVSIVNTDPTCYWLTSFLETALLRAVWYPTTVATRSLRCKRVIKKWLDLTSDDPVGQIGFKLHDFGARGVSSWESAMIGGTAHLVNFMGTDTTQALVGARVFYGEEMAGFSIPAAEHSTITSWGRENEAQAYSNMIDQFAGDGKLYAVVSDSYDIFNAVENLWGGELRDKVLQAGGTLVIRPDSGIPHEVVAKVVALLDKQFGSTINSKGFRVLNPAVRVIQGDGINEESINGILFRLFNDGYAADNVTFGMGGEMLQTMNRDTMRWAMKCSSAFIDGDWRDVYKDPITDSGKRSKRGLLALVRDQDGYETVQDDGHVASELRTVFSEGVLVGEQTFTEIRSRAASAV